VQVTLMSYIGDGGGRPVLDSYIETLARPRDEGFRRLWSSQLPTEPDLLTGISFDKPVRLTVRGLSGGWWPPPRAAARTRLN
jgi:hypothetical protein